MHVSGYRRSWDGSNATELEAALRWRDSKDGGVFWVAHPDRQYPLLGIRVSGDIADVHYFPHDGHPGYRCLGGALLPDGGMTTLRYEGCDPATGEETPNEFILSFEAALAVAVEFLADQRIPTTAEWYEL